MAQQIKHCILLEINNSRDSGQDNTCECAKVDTGAQYLSRSKQQIKDLSGFVRVYNMKDIRQMSQQPIKD